MALVVETGSASTTAESYASVADADAYWSKRGNAAWSALDTSTKEQNLRKATDFMEQVYRLRWKGIRLTATQALSWPRAFVTRMDYYATGSTPPDDVDGNLYYPTDVVPVEVVKSCIELAYKTNGTDLNPDLSRLTKREKVDVIEVEYADNSPQYTTYRSIDQTLAPLLMPTSNSAKVVRS